MAGTYRLSRKGAASILALTLGLLYLPVLLRSGTFLVHDHVLSQLPYLEVAGRGWRSLRVPWWDPSIFAGYPFIGSYYTAFFFPTHALFSWFEPIASFKLHMASSGCLAVAFAYRLLRRARLSRAAAVTGALALLAAADPFQDIINVGRIVFLVPAALLATDRLGERPAPGRFALLALAFAGSALAGLDPGFPAVVGMSVAYALFAPWSSPAGAAPIRRALSTAGLAALAALLALALAAPQVAESLDFYPLTTRVQTPIAGGEAGHSGYGPPSVLGLFLSRLGGSPQGGDQWTLSHMQGLGFLPYVGPVAALLAALGLARGRGRLRAYAALSFVAIVLLMMGSNTPVHGWAVQLVPSLGKFRGLWYKLQPCLAVSLGCLVALGAEALLARRRGWTALALGGLMTAVLATLAARPILRLLGMGVLAQRFLDNPHGKEWLRDTAALVDAATAAGSSSALRALALLVPLLAAFVWHRRAAGPPGRLLAACLLATAIGGYLWPSRAMPMFPAAALAGAEEVAGRLRDLARDEATRGERYRNWSPWGTKLFFNYAKTHYLLGPDRHPHRFQDGRSSPFLEDTLALVPPNLNMLLGTEDAGGDGSVYQASTYALFRHDEERDPRLATLRLYNVRRLVLPLREEPAFVRLPTEAELAGWRLLWRDRVAVYEAPDPLPRAYLAGHALPVGGAREVRERLMAGEVDPRRTVLVEGLGTPEGETLEAASLPAVRIRSHEPCRVVLDLETPREAWLVLLDAHHPSWGASVDGVPSPVRRAFGHFRAVRVPEGAREVVFEYRPAHLGVSASLSALAALALAACLAAAKRSRASGP